MNPHRNTLAEEVMNHLYTTQDISRVRGIAKELLTQRPPPDLADGNAHLRAEVLAVLESIPETYRVRVREGGGEENIAASLAVSVAKLVSHLGNSTATGFDGRKDFQK